MLDIDGKPWPRRGEKLVRPGGRGEEESLNACFFMTGSFHLYTEGYKEAAQRLFEWVSQRHVHQDRLVYPFVFSWRHYLELRLKEMISTGRYLRDKEPGYPDHHRIKDLWIEARWYLEDVEAECAEYDATEESINQFADVDPNSIHFRYPTKRDGKPTVPAGTPNMHLGQFHSVMLGVARFLDAAQMELDRRMDYKLEAEAPLREMQAEYEREMQSEYESAMSDLHGE